MRIASPSSGIDAFSWEFGAGALASISRLSTGAPIIVSSGPLVSVGSEIRFAGAETFASSPSERLRDIELAGRLRGNERSAVNRLLSAANLAALSAAASADSVFAEAKVAYLEKEARRIEIEFGNGRQSRSQLAQSQDLWTRARLEAEDLRYNAESFGREARAASLALHSGPSSAFVAAELYPLAFAIAPLLSDADPAAAAMAEAAAPWDLRAAELAVAALTDAPLLSFTFDFSVLPGAGSQAPAPSASGTVDLSVPLGRSVAERGRKVADLAALRKVAVESAGSTVALRFSEARRAMELRGARIARLEALASERETRARAWAKLAEEGSATFLDSLAAASGLAEARASLDREKAGYFLATITAFADSGLPLSAIPEALPAAVLPPAVLPPEALPAANLEGGVQP